MTWGALVHSVKGCTSNVFFVRANGNGGRASLLVAGELQLRRGFGLDLGAHIGEGGFWILEPMGRGCSIGVAVLTPLCPPLGRC